MNIFISALMGNTMAPKAESSDAIDNVKCKIQNKEGTPPVFAGNQLEDICTLSGYKIEEKSPFHLAI
jgi:large subunit ribosomal protein L40e